MVVTPVDFKASDEPPEPDWLSMMSDELDVAAATEYWRSIVSAMRSARTLTVENGHQIRRLVVGYVLWDRASERVLEHGAVRANGRKSPDWMVMRQADEACSRHEAELGIPPLKRGRAGKVPPRERRSLPSDRYLKRRD